MGNFQENRRRKRANGGVVFRIGKGVLFLSGCKEIFNTFPRTGLLV
jgi:hypothetical protein